MSDYRFVKLSAENITDLLPIYESAYGKAPDIESVRKKFGTGVFGHSHVGYIAYSPENEPAAFYGVFPCFLKYQGEKIYAAQSGDTMTHRNHQGKGLFVSLAKETYAYARSVGIKVVFGFPNENSFPGFVRKLDWHHYDDLSAYLIRVPCLPFIRLNKLLKLSGDWQVRLAATLLKFFKAGSAFESSVIDEEFGGVNRDEVFVNYKTYSPNYLVSIAGKSVWVKPEGMFMMIGDIERCSDAERDKILRKLKLICFWAGIPHLRFHCSSGVFHEAYFKQQGKKHERTYPVGYVKWNLDIDFTKMKFTTADNDTF